MDKLPKDTAMKAKRLRVASGLTLEDRLGYYSIPITESGCWIWTGATFKKTGYGRLQHQGRSRSAHRLSWEMHNGPVPVGKLVLHRCDVRCCINPEHLFVGTQRQNMRDMVMKGRSAAGERNARSKLTPRAVTAIRASNESTYKLGKRYGVTNTAIWLIKNRPLWRDV